MNHILVIVHEFGNYVKGQIVSEVSEIEQILASHNHTHVNKIAGKPTDKTAVEAPPAPPAPAPAASPSPTVPPSPSPTT